jgi:methylglutaconyl-CoA hydratase
MTEPTFRLEIDTRGIATLTLNRPEVANAYDEALLLAMTEAMARLATDKAVRALVIRGAGKHFQAGADIRWLNHLSRQGPEANYEASIVTVRFSRTLNEFPKPTIAVIHGACFGGGVGIACCVDVALATPDAQFGITEVRVGIAPTPISTFMVGAIGLRQTRRYALTGERFGAEEAARIGLVHEVVPTEEIEVRLAHVLHAILASAPGAIAATKLSFLGANNLLLTDRDMALLAHEGWMQRQSPEGQEGTSAFREKRRPDWYPKPEGECAKRLPPHPSIGSSSCVACCWPPRVLWASPRPRRRRPRSCMLACARIPTCSIPPWALPMSAVSSSLACATSCSTSMPN